MTKDVQRWADPAMYAAQEVSHEPQVQLLSANSDPLGTIAACAEGYKGKFYSSLAEISDIQRRFYINDLTKSALVAPAEFVHFHFRISGVTRGFTHQMVRQRTACYVQESTRFAVKESVPVALPPSLAGTISWTEWLQKCRYDLFPKGTAFTVEQDRLIHAHAEKMASPAQRWRREWDITVHAIGSQYNNLVNSGMPAEDARGLLPTNILTQINYNTTLRGLMEHSGLRLCTQAQFEWRLVWDKILKTIREYGNNQWYHDGEALLPSGWQFEEIAKMFKPICYKTGKCEFMGSADRFCKIRDRVEANHRNNRPSSAWHEQGMVAGGIPPIKDEEWMLDPTAARQ